MANRSQSKSLLHWHAAITQRKDDRAHLSDLLLKLPLLFEMHEIWSVDSQENYSNCCHQMSDFKAKMHHFDFGWGPAPDPTGVTYSAPPDSLAGFKEGKGEGKKRGRERRVASWLLGDGRTC